MEKLKYMFYGVKKLDSIELHLYLALIWHDFKLISWECISIRKSINHNIYIFQDSLSFV
jgi:hypothetical protein